MNLHAVIERAPEEAIGRIAPKFQEPTGRGNQSRSVGRTCARRITRVLQDRREDGCAGLQKTRFEKPSPEE